MIRAKLTPFQDVSRTVITGNQLAVALRLDQLTSFRLTSENTDDLAMQVRTQMVKSSSLLKDTYEEMSLAEKLLVRKFVRHG